MAKKKTRAADSSSVWHTCNSCKLAVTNSNISLILRLDVVGEDGKPYVLHVDQLNDRTWLVQRTLRLIGDRWPAFDWQFQANDSGNLTDVR